MEQDAGSQIPEPLCFIHPGEGFVQLFSFCSDNFFRFSLKNKGLKADERFRAFFRQVKKGQHVLRGKANAAVGVRCSEAVRPVGAVDVDVALPRIGVSGSRPSSHRMRVRMKSECSFMPSGMAAG